MAKYFSSSVLSGKRRKPPRERIDEQRYRYLGLEHAEPDLGDPKVGPSSEGANPVKSGDQYIVVAVDGFPGERFWIPNQGGLIPGSISVFDETNLVGSLSSITQLDFLGAGVKATTQTVKVSTLNLSGNFSFSKDQIVTQIGNSGVSGAVEFSTTNSGIVTLTNVNGNFNTSGELQQAGNATGVTPSSISIFNDPSIRAQIEVTPEFFSENRQFIFNDNDEFNGALNLTYNQSNDYVGVGTTAATQMLHVQGNLRLTGTVYDSNNFEGAAGNLLVKKSGSEELIWVDQGTIQPNAGGIRGSVQYHNEVGKIGGASNFVFNDISGVNNVGIGSTLPQVDLDVVGVASITGNLKVGTLNVQGISTYGGNLDINASVDILNNLNVGQTLDVGGNATFTGETITFTGADYNAIWNKSDSELEFADNAKATFGDDADLKIYHSGSHSHITDTGVGNLSLQSTGGEIQLAKGGTFAHMVRAVVDGSVELYHAGTKRLETNTTGILVHDTVTATTFNATDSELTDVTITGLADIFRADIEQLTVVNGVGIATIKEIDATHTDTDTLNVGTAATTAKLTVDNIEIDGNNITATTGNLIISGDGSSFVKIDKVEITDTTDFSGTNAALIVKGGADIDKKLNVDGAVTFTKDTESTNPTTGALKITGGVGIAKRLNVAGITSITNTTSSTGIYTGAFKVAGGAGILGSLYVGGSVGFGSTAVPSVNNQHDFGSTLKKWKNIYADEFVGKLAGSAEKTDITEDSTNTNRFIFLSDVFSGTATAFGDQSLIYNPSINALGIATNRFDSPISSDNTGKIAVGIVTAYELYGSLRGNADTATKLLNARDFSISGDGTAPTISFDGTDNVPFVFTLSTVNSNVGTFGNDTGTAYARVSVNAKGLVTAAEEVNIDGDEITSGEAKNVAITEQTDSTTTHYIHFGDVVNTDLGDKTTYDRINVDSSELVYIPNTGVGIGSTAPTTKLDVFGTTKTLHLNVTGVSTFVGNVDINNQLIVGGATTLANSGGITTTGGDLYVGGNLFVKDDVFNDQLLGESMVITGIATINQLEIGQLGQTLVGITTILDEDDMVSDSATALATQQSIKKYVDDTVDAANDLAFSGDTGTGTIDLDSETFSITGSANEIVTSVPSDNNLQIRLAEDLTLRGNTTLGDDPDSDTVTFTAKVNSSIIPSGTVNIGAESSRWDYIYATNVDGVNFAGTSADATKLETPRKISFNEDVVSIASTFDGTQNVGFALTLTTTGVEDGTYGSSTQVGILTVDTKGRVTAASNVDIDGSALTAGKADKILVTEKSSEMDKLHYLTFIENDPANSGDYENLYGDNQLTYNPNTNALSINGNMSSGSLNVSGLSTFLGNVTIGDDESVDQITISASVASTFFPTTSADTNETSDGVDLGKSDQYWRKIYVRELIGDTVTAISTAANTVGIGSTDTDADHYITFVDFNDDTTGFGTIRTDDGIKYNPNTNILDISGDVKVGTGLVVTGISTLNGDVNIGDTDSDTVSINAKVDTNIIPSGTIDIGATDSKINKIYTNELFGTLKDNADSATKFATPQQITFNEDVVSIASTFDGTQNVGIALTLKTVNTSNGVPGTFGSSTAIPKIKVNAKGLVTEIETVTADFLNQVTNDANNIKITENEDDATHYLTFISTDPASITSENEYQSLLGDSGLRYNPHTNRITAGNLTLDGTADPSLSVTGNASFSADVLISGITTIGDANSDTLTINAKVNSAILPSHDATEIDDADGIDIGSSSDHFRVIYATKFDGALAGKSDSAAKLDPGKNITITGTDFSGGELNDEDGNAIPFTGENNYAIPLELSTTDVTEGSYPDLDTNDNTKVNKVPRIAVDTKGRITGVTNHDLILSQSTLTLSGKNTAILFNNNNSVGHADGFRIIERTSGGVIGTTFQIDTVASSSVGGGNPGTIPAISYHGKLQNSTVLRISGNNDNYYADDGFSILYMGARPDNAASLSIFSDNQNVANQVEAVNILQNGNIGFGVVQETDADEHTIPTSGGGVITAGKIKAREFEVTGDIIVKNITELPGIGFTNLSDTPSTFEDFGSRYVQVNSAETGLVFNTISTTDISNFDTAVNNLITSNTSISYDNITGTPTLADVATSGAYGDLSGTPSLATVATSGDYDDLSGTPTIPTNNNQLTNGAGYITSSDLDGNTTYQLKATRNADGSNSGGNNTDPYLHLQGTDGNDDNVRLVGSGAVSVTRNNNGQVTINAPVVNAGVAQGTNPYFGYIELRRDDGNNYGGFIDFVKDDFPGNNSANSPDYHARMVLRTTNNTGTTGAVAGNANTNEVQLWNSRFNVKDGLLKGNTIEAVGNITAFTSDIRLKKDIEPIKNALEKVQSLRGFTYSHNETAKELGFTEDRRWSGVSAQEIEKVLPEAVFPAPVNDKYLTVQYEKIVPLLIEAIKELKEEVNDLRSQIGG